MRKKYGKKRIFLTLLGASLLLLAAVGALIIYMTVEAGSPAVMYIRITEIALVCAGFLLALAGIIIIGVCLLKNSYAGGPLSNFLTKAALRMYPLAIWFGKLFRMSSDNIRASFIEINNQLVQNSRCTVPPDRLLVLLPHCLQQSQCGKKLTDDISRCSGCGRCDIYEINRLCSRLGVHVAVATGGTLARKIAAEIKPRAIVAVACERDLFSGILDVRPLPAVGVVNMRPEGPCHNTRVDISVLEHAIRQLITEPLPAEG